MLTWVLLMPESSSEQDDLDRASPARPVRPPCALLSSPSGTQPRLRCVAGHLSAMRGVRSDEDQDREPRTKPGRFSSVARQVRPSTMRCQEPTSGIAVFRSSMAASRRPRATRPCDSISAWSRWSATQISVSAITSSVAVTTSST